MILYSMLTAVGQRVNAKDMFEDRMKKKPSNILRNAIGVVVGAVILPSAAAEPLEIAGWTIEPSSEVALVLSPGRSDAGQTDSENVLGELRGEVRVERVLDNGVEIGVRLGGKVQRDHPARSGFAGRIGDAAAPLGGLAPRGAFTGLTLGGEAEDTNLQAQLETAFIYADGGYGQILLGRDQGIARRFFEGSPSVFRKHRIASPALDTSGISLLLTRNDLTGPAAKISYASPRILGLRLGASYTPRANISGLDRDPDRDVVGVLEPRLESAAEAALNFSHRFRSSGIRLETYGAYGRADLEVGENRSESGTVEVWSAGSKITWENLEFGGDWLTTDNGAGRYRAWSTGLKAELFGFDWSAEYGQSDDNLSGFDGESWSFGVSHRVLETLTVSTGVQSQSLNSDAMLSQTSLGPVLEMILNF